MPNVSNLVKKTDYNTKISESENKIATEHDCDRYTTTKEFNKLIAQTLVSRLSQENLTGRNDIAKIVKKTDFYNKLKNSNEMLLQMKQNMYLLKIN